MFSKIRKLRKFLGSEWRWLVALVVFEVGFFGVLLLIGLQPVKHRYTVCTWNASHTVSVCREEWK